MSVPPSVWLTSHYLAEERLSGNSHSAFTGTPRLLAIGLIVSKDGAFIRRYRYICLHPHLQVLAWQAENNKMKRLLAILLCMAIPAAISAADNSYKVTYDGGSVPDIKTGTDLKLYIESNQLRLTRDKKDVITIPASSVTEISYGQDVHRRVGAAIGLAVVSFGIGALMALTKSKKHFIGLTWATGDQKGGFAMQCDKNDYRGVLSGLEGVTGKKAVNSDALNVKN
jgi:hypothetical protein